MDNKTTRTQEQYGALIRILNGARYAYYLYGASSLSDAQYDHMMNVLEAIEKEQGWVSDESPTNHVGIEGVDNLFNPSAPLSPSMLDRVKHPVRVASLKNCYDMDDLKKWMANTCGAPASADYVFTPKMDGVSLIATYTATPDGVILQRLATRGDGDNGDDVTHNASLISGLPSVLDTDWASVKPGCSVTVRGEVIIDNDSFAKINENEEVDYKTPRNLAAGTIRQTDANVVGSRYLHFYAFDIAHTDDPSLNVNYVDALNIISAWGISIVPYFQIDDIEFAINWMENKLKKAHYDTDGVVVRINRYKKFAELGSTGHHPRGAIAYKFKSETATTKLRNVIVTVGRTGVIHPTAELEPIEIGGVTISKATLHNYDFVKSIDLHWGDTVEITRAGEVIPQVLGVVKSERDVNATPVTPPTQCFYCDWPIKSDEGSHQYCTNPSCPERRLQQIVYWCSIMDIKGVSEQTIKQLMSDMNVRDTADLYRLTVEDLVKLDGFKVGKAENVVSAIQQSKARPFWQVLAALGIDGIGRRMSKRIVAMFPSYEKIKQTVDSNPATLKVVDGMGDSLVDNFTTWFTVGSNRHFIGRLRDAGLQLEDQQSIQPKTQTALTGKTVVVTGTLSQPRNHFSQLIESAGGTVGSSVSKKTDYLLAGDNAGSKLQKAQKAGVQIITEDEFTSLVKPIV